jgi:hypothetical protein
VYIAAATSYGKPGQRLRRRILVYRDSAGAENNVSSFIHGELIPLPLADPGCRSSKFGHPVRFWRLRRGRLVEPVGGGNQQRYPELSQWAKPQARKRAFDSLGTPILRRARAGLWETIVDGGTSGSAGTFRRSSSTWAGDRISRWKSRSRCRDVCLNRPSGDVGVRRPRARRKPPVSTQAESVLSSCWMQQLRR